MKDKFETFLKDIFHIETMEEITFKKLYGFHFAFKTTHVIIKNEISSSEIKPVGIIYEENGEYYLAPIDKKVNISEVVKNFVKKCL